MMSTTTLTDLPPELLDHIVSFLQTAKSVKNLGATNKTLQAYVAKNAWKNFVVTRFPSIHPVVDTQPYNEAARTLTTLSKAWDRRAFLARYIEPRGNIRAFPQNQPVDRWTRPRGQTVGFVPQLDCFDAGPSSQTRNETLAFSAGAGICIRQTTARVGQPGNDVKWMVYRPHGAGEGIDDVTSLHLLRPQLGDENIERPLQVITGTANGDLQLLSFSPDGKANDVPQSYFVTQGQPVRSSSVLQRSSEGPMLLAANLGDARISLYEVDSHRSKIEPGSSTDISVSANGHRNHRAWSTKFLSSDNLAVGLGPSTHPVQIYSITPSGISKEALRKFSLQNDDDYREDEVASPEFVKKPASSIYPIVPLPAATHGMGGGSGQVFLSGAYDGIIRVHDLRSKRDVEQTYVDPTDDSAIYSLLTRGRETLVAGTSRHSLLKVFDMRLGAKAYSYLNADPTVATESGELKDWNLFLKPHSATYPGRGGGNNWARRSAESSIYTLASSSPCSPFVYAGVENAVLELAFTSVLDPHPDPVFGGSSAPTRNGDVVHGFRSKEALDLSMYDQTAEMMKLKSQRSLWDTFRMRHAEPARAERALPGLDERWRLL